MKIYRFLIRKVTRINEITKVFVLRNARVKEYIKLKREENY